MAKSVVVPIQPHPPTGREHFHRACDPRMGRTESHHTHTLIRHKELGPRSDIQRLLQPPIIHEIGHQWRVAPRSLQTSIQGSPHTPPLLTRSSSWPETIVAS